MPFANVESPAKTYSGKKLNYLDLSSGIRVIRILNENAVRFNTHWVGRGSIQCLGEDCPICQNNLKIYTENPKDFRSVSGWNPTRTVFFVNVLDRTPVKICSCGNEVYKEGQAYPNTCPACGNFVTNIQALPSNKIKVLSRGVDLFSQLNSFEETELDEAGNPIPITSFDIMLKISGTGRERKILAQARANQNDPVTYNKEDLFDLSNAVIKLSASEILQLLKGVSLKDIFAARSGETSEKSSDEVENIRKDVKDKVANLFNY